MAFAQTGDIILLRMEPRKLTGSAYTLAAALCKHFHL